ncbi:hypothetical protein GSI_11131 [Ganoderma sinense ZZ0214-1]|uniref:Uncharacterized protein n=1 Tax=Ganoderma sinense ZZ0214-1 TaxID=1077348 RepID=A0A2G8RZ71_9APHY|nr:hypothetical protein GSI_11131 [Ganoderma sinense ZZ0214-1]
MDSTDTLCAHPTPLTPLATQLARIYLSLSPLMSQETLVTQSSLSDAHKSAISWFPARRPSGYEALPYEEPGEDSDVDTEHWALKPASDIEASPTTRPLPASGSRKIEGSSTDGPSAPCTMMMRGVAGTVAIHLIAGLPATLFFGAYSWIIGGIVLCALARLPPYDTMDVNGTFWATMAGAPVVSLIVGALALVDLVLRRLPNLRQASRPGADHLRQGRDTRTTRAYEYDAADDAVAISSICAPLSVFAMPVGLLMMPRLVTETFGVWNGLAVSATGFGVLVAGLSVMFALEVVSRR